MRLRSTPLIKSITLGQVYVQRGIQHLVYRLTYDWRCRVGTFDAIPTLTEVTDAVAVLRRNSFVCITNRSKRLSFTHTLTYYIYISQAVWQGLAVFGVRRSIVLKQETMKLQLFAKVTILYQLIWNLAWVIKLGRLPALPNLVWIWLAVETLRRGNIYGYCGFYLLFIFQQSYDVETVRDTRNVSMNHDYETGVALSDSVYKTFVKSPLAEKSRWHHIQLAIKPSYLGNHASQIKKSYYGSLSGSHGLSFRNRHEKVRAAPPGEGLTMMSYPASKKNLVSSEKCI